MRPRRLTVTCAAGLAALLLAGAAGCSSFDRTFGQQEAVVHFRPQTPNTTRLKVREACAHVPSATPEPVPKHGGNASMSYAIRYQVGNASDADLAKLQQCLEKFPSVVGLEFSGPAGS